MKKYRKVFAALILTVAVALVGCGSSSYVDPDPDPNPSIVTCETSDQCTDGQVCIYGKCKECATDDDCEGDMICNPMCGLDFCDHQCIEPACTADADCGADYICLSGRCSEVSPDPDQENTDECKYDSDCAEGFRCKGDKKCHQICEHNDDCPSGEQCVYVACGGTTGTCMEYDAEAVMGTLANGGC